jgi:hypothetical protein
MRKRNVFTFIIYDAYAQMCLREGIIVIDKATLFEQQLILEDFCHISCGFHFSGFCTSFVFTEDYIRLIAAMFPDFILV